MKNRIRQFREALKLSQHALALKVGTSQQQIQRFETDQTAVKLHLAIKLSDALGKPLNVIFPGATTAIKKADAEAERTNLLPETGYKNMRAVGIEGDLRRWRVSILLRGQTNPVHFSDIQTPDIEGLRRELCDAREFGDEVKFVLFDTQDHRIALNVAHTVYCNFGWEPEQHLWLSPEKLPDSDSQTTVTIYFVGGSEAVTLEVPVDDGEPERDDGDYEDGQFGNILGTLQYVDDPSFSIIIEDADDDELFFRAGDLALLSVPLYVIEPGNLEEELLAEEADKFLDKVIQSQNPAT